ncbi:MAG: HDOD domain-containing protein [Thiohalomonadaceae bacterium]
MHNTLNLWVDKLQHVTLPAMSPTVEELDRLSANENAQFWQLAQVAERDPGICIALLRHINTGRQNKLRSEVNTIENALMMLGLTQLRSLLKSLVLMSKVENSANKQKFLRLMAQSYHAAWQARELARLRKDMEVDEIFLATLLHCQGAMLLWLYAPGKMEQIEKLATEKQIPHIQAQYAVLGFGLNHLSLMLARRWNLPSLLQESLKSENAKQPRTYNIMLAVQLARAAEQGWYHAGTTTVLQQLSDYMNLDFSQITSKCHRVAVEAARQIIECPATPAAARLIYPGQAEAEPNWTPENTTITNDPATTKTVPNKEPTVALCLSPQLHILRRSLHELQAGSKTKRLDLQNILSLAMDAMHDGTGLERVVFAQLSQYQQLRARAIAGADNDPVFSRFVIELNTDNLFTRLMQKPQAIWINDSNREKFWPIVPKAFQQIIRCDSFFVLSVFVNDKPIGLLYADRITNHCALDSRAYHRFKQTGLLIAQAMGNMHEQADQ